MDDGRPSGPGVSLIYTHRARKFFQRRVFEYCTDALARPVFSTTCSDLNWIGCCRTHPGRAAIVPGRACVDESPGSRSAATITRRPSEMSARTPEASSRDPFLQPRRRYAQLRDTSQAGRPGIRTRRRGGRALARRAVRRAVGIGRAGTRARTSVARTRLESAVPSDELRLGPSIVTTIHPPGNGANDVETILIVGESVDLCRMFRRVLTLAGYEVREAGDGAAALRLLDGRTPDLVVLDLEVPPAPSLRQVAEQARAREVPAIIIVAAASPLADLPRANCVLTRPVTPERLIATVRRYIDGSRGQRALTMDGHVSAIPDGQ